MTSPEEQAARRAAKRVQGARDRNEPGTPGRPDVDEVGLDHGQRREARTRVATDMSDFRAVDGDDIPGAGLNLIVPDGTVATAAPSEAGVVQADLPVTPGQSYVAGVTTTTDTGWVGLQWVTADGRGADIVWGGGSAGRVVVNAPAPEYAGGVRMLLVAYAPVDPPGTDSETARILASLRAHVTSGEN